MNRFYMLRILFSSTAMTTTIGCASTSAHPGDLDGPHESHSARRLEVNEGGQVQSAAPSTSECMCYRGGSYSPGLIVEHDGMTRICLDNGTWKKGTFKKSTTGCVETRCSYAGTIHSVGSYRQEKFCRFDGSWGTQDPVP